MKALILAAGLGSRLKENTKNKPKAMIQIDSKPIISHQIESLKYNKIYKIGVVLGYKKDVLKNYLLSNHQDIDFSFFSNDEYETSNSAYSFYKAYEFIKSDTYIHLNCDIIFSSELLKRIINSKYKNVIALSKNLKLKDNMEQVALDSDKKILKMDNINFNSATFKAYGLAKLSSESSNFIFKIIEEDIRRGDKKNNYYGIIRKAVLNLKYYGLDCNDDLLLEVNTLKDMEIVKNLMLSHKIKYI